MVSTILLLLWTYLVSLAQSANFPLTAVTEYTSLAPCAASHLTQELNGWIYEGCSSNTPISAYGSCICAQRMSSIQREVSIDFEFDPECSTTGVQPYLTAFCNRWGVDLAAAEKGPATTTKAGTPSTGTATPGSTGAAGQPAATSTSSPPGATPSNGVSSGGSGNDNKITIIATVVGAVAGVIAIGIAWKTYKTMKKNNHPMFQRPSHANHLPPQPAPQQYPMHSPPAPIHEMPGQGSRGSPYHQQPMQGYYG
ncbi:MAG: hypothetical protein Q9220_001588 [cf. Caloplaca sp. 1 TL-2023]